MMFKQKRKLLVIAVYVLIMIGFALYWGNNFSKFVHYKGGAEEAAVKFSVLLSYLFFTVLVFNDVKFKGWLILLLPLALMLLSFFSAIALLFILGLGGTPRQLIWIYLVPYIIFAVLATLMAMKNKKAIA
ncbi:hypothetical protein [Mucilaginibacter psychrotolerans]|uniref:Uncharacterized protein n=1 Tax=Mucilaginibacter psychrotolerans TaxID=1524096 RepID=A0A4Y8SHW2_9SPHI|nr:hypothetical protein [Mucilaginibacter psychrotolerans]TFF38024.1 hypothetical protein E2R66_10600 [Mucilaginibacter psychrotolerans]